MRGPAILVACLALIVAALGFALKPKQDSPVADAKPRVKLAVLVVFDQLRGDLPEKWKPLFGDEGFVRLQTEGATFINCHYPYGTTTTGPGHASMLSGTCPDQHGIVNNNWYDSGAVVYCAGSTRYEFVPAPSSKPDPKAKAKEAGTPERMLAETVADVLREQTKGKVFGLSLKDRSAILPTGKRPNGAFWFNGKFVTSTYYTDLLPAWVSEFNDSKVADRWFGKDWTRFRANLDYEKWSGPDKVEGEGSGIQITANDDPARGWAQGKTFPHPNTGGRSRPGKEYYEAIANSPIGNELLLEFAKKCVIAEKLGADDVPDLLVVSFSSNDLIGHTWGPDSQEVLDVTLRSDALMADLLRFLDREVGKDQYILALTADHGICPLPEVSRAKGLDAKRINPSTIQKAIEDHLTETFGPPGVVATKGDKKPAWIEAVVFPWVYFNPKVIANAKRSPAEIAKAAAEFVAKRSEIARAFTRADLQGTIPAEDKVGTRVKRSYHPTRSGNLYIVVKEWYLPSAVTFLGAGTGTTHGAPFDYDTHVPLMVLGPGVVGGTKTEPTTPQATAKIFAKWFGIRDPNKSEFPVPVTLGGLVGNP